MKIKILLITTLLVISQFIIAQHKLSGRVIDAETNEPIEYASVSLSRGDSSFVAGVTTNENGDFSFQHNLQGKHFVTFSYVGYGKSILETNLSNNNLELETIRLYPATSLKDVTITADAVIRKIDRQLITPNEIQLKASTNGFDLIQNLQLSRIKTDPINKTMSTVGGGDVQIRINGVQVEVAEISALLPADILRVEYHDEPGIRYGGAGAVIDIITRKKESGGSISTNLENGISKMGFAEDNISAKLNQRKSEFSANAHLRYRQIDWTRENIETFNYPDKVLQRTEIGNPTEYNEKKLSTKLNYSYVEKDRYFINIALKYHLTDIPHEFMNREGRIYSEEKNIPLDVKDFAKSKVNLPSLDLYFQRDLSKEELVIFNVVGTYIDSRSTRLYQESQEEKVLTDIFSDVSGDKYSLIAEGIYEKRFSSSKLSGGIKHLQAYTNNIYRGTTEANIGLNQAETYAYLEFQTKKGKFNYTTGIGLSRNYYSQYELSNKRYIFRPSIRIGYEINDKTNIRLNSYISSKSPSLSDMNNVVQTIDSLQVRKGNPNLKTSWYISNTISAGYKQGVFSTDLFFMHVYDNKPIMSETLFENNKFVQTSSNQKLHQRFHSQISFNIRPWKDYISFSIKPGVNHFLSKGNSYKHSHTNWYMENSLLANYKNIFFNAEFYTRYNWLQGEDFSEGERVHIFSIGYKSESWSAKIGTINLFEKSYTNESKKLSALTPRSSQLATLQMTPMFFIGFSYNFHFGRQFNSKGQRTNNDDRDSGIMSGNK